MSKNDKQAEPKSLQNNSRILLHFSEFLFATMDIDTANWMSRITNSDISIAGLTIPGTHDSGTRDGYSSIIPLFGFISDWWNVTQTTGIDQQLKDGIRFFDIRVGGGDVEDASIDDLLIYHGSYEMNGTTFKKVLEMFVNFLKGHMKETILFTLRNEHGSANKNLFTVYNKIKNSLGSVYFYDDNAAPKLRDVQGKCVLFNRFHSAESNSGINVNNFNDGDNPSSYRLQDLFSFQDAGVKRARITEQMDYALSDSNMNKFYFNFWSGYHGSTGFPKDTEGVMNAIIPSYVMEHTKPVATGSNPPRLGINVMDFYDPLNV